MSGPPPSLLQRHPELCDRLPWIPLGQWPTPVARLAELSRRIGGELWIKRDDLCGPCYGGNKVRKLEHLLGEASAQGRPVITVGGVGSNHVVATGLAGRQLGLKVSAVVVPQPLTAAVRKNAELARRLGVTLIPCPARALAPLYLMLAAARADVSVIGPGGSSPLGTLGYVSAALELVQQIADGELPTPKTIYVALGSGGTLAGLALGCALGGLETRIIGVRVVERVICNAALVRLLIRRTAALLRRYGVKLPRPARFEVEHRQFGGLYGRPTAAGQRAVELCQEEGLTLETTYTGKAMAALLEGPPPPGTTLFWNTFNSRETTDLGSDAAGPFPAVVSAWLR